MMLFSEVYGSYFNAVAAILSKAVSGDLTKTDIYDIIGDKAFAESTLNIPNTLLSGKWPLLTEQMHTPLKHAPSMPLTTLQKRWLKSLLSDPRIRLFDVSCEGLEDVKPLYEQDDIVYFDQYRDGDPFEDPSYIEHFRTVLTALREHRDLYVRFQSGKGRQHVWECTPYRLEYSLKDDKFRLIISGGDRPGTINIARIMECVLLDESDPETLEIPAREKASVVFELTDERNALERAMLHFSHLEKETIKLDDQHYRVILTYNKDDETELLIRILSFGPMIRVTEPASFIELIRERLDMQKKYLSSQE